jgi:hypothetical protein
MANEPTARKEEESSYQRGSFANKKTLRGRGTYEKEKEKLRRG